MSRIPAIAIFDIGKTNKKLLLFNEEYKVVWEDSCQLEETLDEDNDPCEDLMSLTAWIRDSINQVLAMDDLQVGALNFSTYGASFVHIDDHDKIVTPLYNYLKPFPPVLHQKFAEIYGDEHQISLATASPILGNLNSGMQLFRLKHAAPARFNKIRYSLHLPQFLSGMVHGKKYSDITSIGCHTMLWDFSKNNYHEWVNQEGLIAKMGEIFPANQSIPANWNNHSLITGVGLHDSSAALIPYLMNFEDPFALMSTGTWSITLNPFNHHPLTEQELEQDCLCYLEYLGRPVKASRLFAGNDHETQIKRLSAHFQVAEDYYQSVSFDAGIIDKLEERIILPKIESKEPILPQSVFAFRDLTIFEHYAMAYHQLIRDIMHLQKHSAELVLTNTPVKRIFVDGGFSRNPIFMQLLARAFPHMEVYAASLAQASALGTALSIHRHWNQRPMPSDLIELKYFAHNSVT